MACTASPATTSRRPAPSASAPWSTCAPRVRSSAAGASPSRSYPVDWHHLPIIERMWSEDDLVATTGAVDFLRDRYVDMLRQRRPVHRPHRRAGRRRHADAVPLRGRQGPHRRRRRRAARRWSGVPHEEIAADYHATAGAMAAFVDWLTVDLPRGARLDDEPAARVPRGPARGDARGSSSASTSTTARSRATSRELGVDAAHHRAPPRRTARSEPLSRALHARAAAPPPRRPPRPRAHGVVDLRDARPGGAGGSTTSTVVCELRDRGAPRTRRSASAVAARRRRCVERLPRDRLRAPSGRPGPRRMAWCGAQRRGHHAVAGRERRRRRRRRRCRGRRPGGSSRRRYSGPASPSRPERAGVARHRAAHQPLGAARLGAGTGAPPPRGSRPARPPPPGRPTRPTSSAARRHRLHERVPEPGGAEAVGDLRPAW